MEIIFIGKKWYGINLSAATLDRQLKSVVRFSLGPVGKKYVTFSPFYLKV